MATASFLTSHPELINWKLILDERKKYGCLINSISTAKLDWSFISCLDLSESFIRLYYDKLNWFSVIRFSNISDDIIREFKDYIPWDDICRARVLSEDIIREFHDKVNWNVLHSKGIYSNILYLENNHKAKRLNLINMPNRKFNLYIKNHDIYDQYKDNIDKFIELLTNSDMLPKSYIMQLNVNTSVLFFQVGVDEKDRYLVNGLINELCEKSGLNYHIGDTCGKNCCAEKCCIEIQEIGYSSEVARLHSS